MPTLTPEQARVLLTTLINEVKEKLTNQHINPIASNKPIEDYEQGIVEIEAASAAVDNLIAIFKQE